MVETPSRSATRAIETAPMPSASAIARPASTIWSSVSARLGPRVGWPVTPQASAMLVGSSGGVSVMGLFRIGVDRPPTNCVYRTHYSVRHTQIGVTMDGPMIETEGLRKSYVGSTVLRGVDLTVAAGE